MLLVMVPSLLIGVLDLVCPCSAAAAIAFPVVFIPVVFASFYANALDVFGKITPMSGLRPQARWASSAAPSTRSTTATCASPKPPAKPSASTGCA
jgi:hypothetical protein